MIITVGAIYLVLTLLLYIFQERMIFLPSRAITITPANMGIEAEDVWFESANGKKLHGWFAFHDPDAVTILFSHGNAGNISGRVHTMKNFVDMGFNVLIYDYQGYGKSEGRPTEKGIMQDGLAAWDLLVEEHNISPDRILPAGRSLGGAVTMYIADYHNTRAVALESTFTSMPDVAARVYRIFPVRLLARVEMNSLERIRNFEGAMLVAHSPDDRVIPYDMGRTLYESARGPTQWLEMTGNHNDGYALTGEKYKQAYIEFVNRWFGDES